MRPDQFELEVCILSFLFVFCESFRRCCCLQVTAVVQGGCAWVSVFQFCPKKTLTIDCANVLAAELCLFLHIVINLETMPVSFFYRESYNSWYIRILQFSSVPKRSFSQTDSCLRRYILDLSRANKYRIFNIFFSTQIQNIISFLQLTMLTKPYLLYNEKFGDSIYPLKKFSCLTVLTHFLPCLTQSWYEY